MKRCLLALLLIASAAGAAAQAADAERIVGKASIVLDEIMAVPVQRIPEALLADAEGVAVFPGVMKVGFVAGVERGRGVVTIRQEDRNWSAPRFLTVTTGSLGWQIGATATDLILVFKTRKSVDNLLAGKFKIGADLAAAAGPVGRRAEAATDGQLQAEIYSYSRSRGLFAGASIDGAVIQLDSDSEFEYYRPGIDGKATVLPDSATKFVALVDKYSTSTRIETAVVAEPAGVVMEDPLEKLRKEMAASADQLSRVLDDSWKRHLALPADVYADGGKPSAAALASALQRYDQVARDPKYAALARRPEFQRARLTLQQYHGAVESDPSDVLPLPPPPVPANSLPR